MLFRRHASYGSWKLFRFGYDYFEKLMRRNVAEVISADTLKVDDSAEESMDMINLGIHKVKPSCGCKKILPRSLNLLMHQNLW